MEETKPVPRIITVPTIDGSRDVIAIAVIGQWAFHVPPGFGWNVTHLGTGYSAVNCSTTDDAEKVLHALASKELTGVDDKSGLAAVKAALSAIGIQAGGNRQRVSGSSADNVVKLISNDVEQHEIER